MYGHGSGRHHGILRSQGGLSNYLFKVSVDESAATEGLKEPVLVRVFGPLERDVERENGIAALLGERGIGPRLWATFANGRVEQYFDKHRTLEPSEFLGDGGGSIAGRLAALHAPDLVLKVAGLDKGQHSDCASEAAIWAPLGAWIQGADEAIVTGRFSQRPAQQQAKLRTVLHRVRRDVSRWRRAFRQPPPDVATRFWGQLRVCHNDLHVNNLLGPISGPMEVRFIDFEYACVNHVGMDICNCLANIPFMEYIRGSSPTYDARSFPAPERIRPWLERYLSERALDLDPEAAEWVAALECAKVGDPLWEDALRTLLRFRPLAQLQWIPWGIRLAGLQTGEDGFDFVQLALVEFGVYTDYLDSMQQTDPAFYAVWEEGSGVLE
jgi:thiamine kinase-like enzyme